MSDIYKALAAAQSEIKNVEKDRQGYGYKYASLDSITDMLRPILKKHGLAIYQYQTFEDGKITVCTTVTHEQGREIVSQIASPYVQLKGMNDYQSIGAAMTYLRRYALAAIFNIATEEDGDANVSASKQRASQSKKQDAAEKKETLSGYLKQKGVNAKQFCAVNKITNAEQAEAILKDKGALDAMIENFKKEK